MNRPVSTVKGMTTRTEGSARERLLTAANELFYAEGVHAVGIDRVLERAGVAKASLYSTFGSKDALVQAYLQGRHVARQQRIAKKLAGLDNPRDLVLAIFDAMYDLVSTPTFRGCAFVNASAETPGTAVRGACRDSRDWLRSLFIDLAREINAADAEQLGHQINLLYDGAMVAAQMDHDPAAALTAKTMAGALIDASKKAG